ncbi:hypothetical protein C7821_111143 [Streptomyces sp. VMFN-G11Ma]|nr:hypothetical protein C7821_111143 [Streptomyces sp. VMFN-G11Ma]
MELLAHDVATTHTAPKRSLIDHAPEVGRFISLKKLLPLHADVDHVLHFALRALGLGCSMNGLGVGPSLEKSGDVHARVVIFAYDLVLKREHEVHRLRDRVG